MFQLDTITNVNNKENSKKWPYRMLIFRPSGSGKTNALPNLIQQQDSDDLLKKIYLFAKYISKLKYQFLIQKHEDARIKHLHDPGALMEYSDTMDDVYNNIDAYNPKRKKNYCV